MEAGDRTGESEDLYAGFAERYDLGFGPFGVPGEDVTGFFRELFVRHGIRTVLDCACGTGQHLPLFQALGCEVWGSDVSAAMLTQARKNLAGAGLEVPLQQADYRALLQTFQRGFDAVACLGAIGYMPGEPEALRAFQSMRAVLRPGGLLIVTAIPTDKHWASRPRFQVAANTQDFSRIFVMDYGQRTVRYTILDLFHSKSVNKVKLWSAELSVLLRDDQERLLRTAGFDAIEFYGSFRFDAYNRHASDLLIAVAQAART